MNGGSQHCIGGSDQNYPKEKEMQEGKVVSEEALQITKERREARKGKGTECRVPENSKER